MVRVTDRGGPSGIATTNMVRPIMINRRRLNMSLLPFQKRFLMANSVMVKRRSRATVVAKAKSNPGITQEGLMAYENKENKWDLHSEDKVRKKATFNFPTLLIRVAINVGFFCSGDCFFLLPPGFRANFMQLLIFPICVAISRNLCSTDGCLSSSASFGETHTFGLSTSLRFLFLPLLSPPELSSEAVLRNV